MITLLIVDDESIIRRGIHYHIDWKTYDIEVVGEARDGEDGYQQALKLHPDIVITDIKMPKMNGIQMAEKLRSVFPDMAIIFLTGYEEKEYLLSAIHNGINDYVMKSANSQNILNAVLRVKEKLEQEAERTLSQMDRLLSDCLGTIKVSFINSIFSSTANQESIFHQAKTFDFPVMGPHYLPILVPLSCSSEPDSLILALLFHLSAYHPCICWQERYGILGFLNLEEEDSCLSALSELAVKLQDDYPEFQLITGDVFSDFKEASRCFSSMKRAALSICWFPDKSLISSSDIRYMEIPKDLFYLLESEIITAYRNKNTSEFIGKMEQFFSFASQVKLPLEHFRESFQRIVISLCSSSNTYQDACYISGTIEQYVDPSKIFRYILNTFTSGMPKIAHNSIVESARSYIQEHYAETIGLKDIAEYCHVSPSYISKIFKDDIQLGIVQYIHNVRIEKAQELLRSTDMRVTDIALEIGYSDYKRFSLYFLKIVGINPREYRKKHQAN